MAKEVFVLDAQDNVATLVSEEGKAGRAFELEHKGQRQQIKLRQDVPFGHKFAIRRIAKGEQVMKYGHSIGTASANIEPGDHVHIHNVESNRGRGDLASAKAGKEAAR